MWKEKQSLFGHCIVFYPIKLLLILYYVFITYPLVPWVYVFTWSHQEFIKKYYFHCNAMIDLISKTNNIY